MSVEQEYSAGPVETVPHGANDENGENSGGPEFDENGQRVPHGLGQSKSSRRRRRKRKGKGSEAGASDAEGSSQAEGGEVASVQASGDGQSATQDAGQASLSPAPQQQAPRQNGQQHGQGRNLAGPQNGQQQNGQQQNSQQQNGQNAPGGTKRWKKKFRDRQRPEGSVGQQGFAAGPNNAGTFQAGAQSGSFQGNGGGFRGPDTHQPGNSVSGFKRKSGGGFGGGGGGKQQRSGGGGSRGGFVGPMDHSYRVANGNVFETSPSTIAPYGNGGGNGFSGGRGRSYSSQSDSQPIDYSQGRAIPIAEDAPTKIYFFVDDLFFTAKIQETARKMGVKVAFVKNEKEQITALTSAEEQDRPGLIVFDLNNANAKPITLIPKLKAKLKKSTSIVGFLSHLQGDLKAKAIEVGCDTVMPRAAFSQNLPNLLRRYGIEEVEEANFNQ